MEKNTAEGDIKELQRLNNMINNFFGDYYEVGGSGYIQKNGETFILSTRDFLNPKETVLTKEEAASYILSGLYKRNK